MKRSPSPLTLIALGSVVWLIVLGCRVAQVVAEAGVTPTRTAPRPTFTAAPTTQPPTDVPPPPPTAPRLVVPTRAPAPRPAPTRTHTPAPPPTPAPPSTADPYQGYFYRISKNTCASGGNTRIIGTVYERGVKANGIKVRVSYIPGGEAVLPDFTTGVDPNDPNHHDDALQGQYRLGLQEGGLLEGRWYVFVINNLGEQMSPSANVHTDGKPGCNVATVDFTHE